MTLVRYVDPGLIRDRQLDTSNRKHTVIFTLLSQGVRQRAGPTQQLIDWFNYSLNRPSSLPFADSSTSR